MTSKEFLQECREKEIEFVDFRFTDKRCMASRNLRY
jgi:glutamine synthetase